MKKRQERNNQYELALEINAALEAAVENVHGVEARNQLLRYEPTHSRLELESMLSRVLEVLTEVLTPPEKRELFDFFGVEDENSNPEPEDCGKSVKPSTKRARRSRSIAKVRAHIEEKGLDAKTLGWTA